MCGRVLQSLGFFLADPSLYFFGMAENGIESVRKKNDTHIIRRHCGNYHILRDIFDFFAESLFENILQTQ